MIGLAFLLTGGSLPAFADDADEVSQTPADSEKLSERQRRREERRQERESEERLAAAPSQADAKDDSAFVVYVEVEPAMECSSVAVTGSRVPKRVCVPVGQAEQDALDAQEFLRNTRKPPTQAADAGLRPGPF